MINFALPHGRHQRDLVRLLKRIGFCFENYPTTDPNPRPVLKPSDSIKSFIPDTRLIQAKVMRAKDMPMQVAGNQFDLAITGTDWLGEHKTLFPNSPIIPLAKLGIGKVRIVAALHNALPIYSIDDLKEYLHSFDAVKNFRIASEYIYTADHYALENRLHRYKIIHTYGATESSIPEDAEMIIENTETGSTLRANNLRIIDTLMESEACLITNERCLEDPDKKEIVQQIQQLFINGCQ